MERDNSRKSEPHEAEFVRLLTLYQPNMFLFIRSLVLNPDEAAEVLQNTNLVLWEKRECYEDGTNFLAWAFQIARYKLLEQQSQRKRNCVCFSDALVDELTVQMFQQSDSGNDAIDDLRRCLAKLSTDDRELIGRRYSARSSCQAIAEAVGRPVRWVYKALARIREDLLNCLRASNAQKHQ